MRPTDSRAVGGTWPSSANIPEMPHTSGQPFVDVAVFAHHAIEREPLLDALPRGLTEPSPCGGIREQAVERRGELARRARRHQPATGLVQYLRCAAHPRSDN